MIEKISWEDIYPIWQNNLWPNRKSPIESNSAMCYLGDVDIDNMRTTPTFFGYIDNNKIVGVNSGHKCSDNSYRSRGIFVFLEHRNKGISSKLLLATIEQARKENSEFIWSYPRKTSWYAYKKVGFQLSSEWVTSETSENNAYCYLKI